MRSYAGPLPANTWLLSRNFKLNFHNVDMELIENGSPA